MTRNDVYEARIRRAVEKGRTDLAIADECHYYAAQAIDGTDAAEIDFERMIQFVSQFLSQPVINAFYRLHRQMQPDADPELDGTVPHTPLAAHSATKEQLHANIQLAILGISAAETTSAYHDAKAELAQAIVNLWTQYPSAAEAQLEYELEAAKDAIETAVNSGEPLTPELLNDLAELYSIGDGNEDTAQMRAYAYALGCREDNLRDQIRKLEADADAVSRERVDIIRNLGQVRAGY